MSVILRVIRVKDLSEEILEAVERESSVQDPLLREHRVISSSANGQPDPSTSSVISELTAANLAANHANHEKVYRAKMREPEMERLLEEHQERFAHPSGRKHGFRS